MRYVNIYERWRQRSFPHGSSSDPVDELHADPAVADSWVTETVLPFLDSGVYEPAKVDVMTELRNLQQRAVELQSLSGSDDTELLKEYAAYAALLGQVYQRFLAEAPVD